MMDVAFVLDGDLYQAFNFATLGEFRKELKKIEKNGLISHWFKLNRFERYFLKEKYGNVPYINTSSVTFAFYINIPNFEKCFSDMNECLRY